MKLVKRPDAAPLHENQIRRFREELRLTREQFAAKLGVSIETVRVWEAKGRSKPRPETARKILALAKRNKYAMTMDSIYGE